MQKLNYFKEIEDTPVIPSKIKAMFEVMKINKPEWLAILVGCLASVLNGAALPVYSIVFGDVIGVSVDSKITFNKYIILYLALMHLSCSRFVEYVINRICQLDADLIVLKFFHVYVGTHYKSFHL